MVDDKQRPGESEADTPERAPETGSGEASPSTVNEAAGLADTQAVVPPGEPVVAEAGPGAEAVEAQPASTEPAVAEPPPRLPVPPAPPVRRRTPWGAMLLSGIIGGAIVAAAASYGYFYYLPQDNSAISVLFARLGATELALGNLSAQQPSPASAPQAVNAAQEAITKLADRLAKVEATLAAGAGSAAADQTTATKSLSDDVARLSQRMEETTTALQQARESAAAALRAAEAKASQPPSGIGKAEFDGLAERVAGLQQSIASLQQAIQQQTAATSRGDRAVRLAVVAAGLRDAVERGAPFASELQAAKVLMADPQAVELLAPYAATGVPSIAALGRELAALAPSLAKTAHAASGADQSYWQRLQSEAQKLVSVRPINEAAGTDLSAAVARIEAMGKRGDVAGALAELQKLPEAARTPAEPWIKKAQAGEAAIAAARRIEAAAVAALANHP